MSVTNFIESLRCMEDDRRYLTVDDTVPRYATYSRLKTIQSKPRSLQKTPNICKSLDHTLSFSQTIQIKSHQDQRRIKLSKSNLDDIRKRSKTQHCSLAKSALDYLKKDDSTAKKQKARNQSSYVRVDISDKLSIKASQFSIKELNTNFLEQIEIVQKYVSEIYNIPIRQTERNDLIKDLPYHTKLAYFQDQDAWCPHSRLNSQKMSQHIKKIYGVGKMRWLYPGEESAVLNGMVTFLELSAIKPSLLVLSLSRVISQILNSYRLEYLKELPVCMQQITYHWKMLATIFKHKYKSIFIGNKNTRLVQQIMSKNHFIDNQDPVLLAQLFKQNLQ